MSYEKMKAKDLSMEIAKRLYPGDNGHHARLRSCAAYDGVSYLCDSWEKMGPLIASKNICLNYVKGEGWFACSYFNQWLTDMQFMHDNPLRAAAECWLVMDDKERGNV